MPTAPGRVPRVAFLCTHNAGRSQMAAGWARHLAAGGLEVLSAGSEPAEELNPVAVRAMAEVGIDIAGQRPKAWSEETLRDVDVIVTMGCGDRCPVVPGARTLDWDLEDPAGRPIEDVRAIRDEIERRVRSLLAELGVSPTRP
ncbi:MAG: low molecular weight phosphotyrosine protein phosphatase [Actinomycetota bacterium]|jgi:arsenate reductase|nr:MAG: low molecular weight phosphotyrosine protein phosphatase [Actinomycetota bacterium]